MEFKFIRDYDPETLERTLGQLSAEGWELHSTSCALVGITVLFVAVMQRRRPAK